MRCVHVLLFFVPIAIVNAAAPPGVKAPRLDVNDDPLPRGAVARLGTVRFQPHDPFEDEMVRPRRVPELAIVALSPDGRTVAAAMNGDRGCKWIDVMDTATGKMVRKLELAGVRPAGQMQFTPDGKRLVLSSCSGLSGIQVLDAQSGKVVLEFSASTGFYNSFALSTDGKWVAIQPDEHVENAPVVVREMKTGQEVMSPPGRGASFELIVGKEYPKHKRAGAAPLPGLGAACKGLAFSPDAKRLLLWSIVPDEIGPHHMNLGFKAALACIDLPTRKIVGKKTVDGARFVALCPDGETVAIESADHRSVRIHHLPTGKDIYTIPVKSGGFSFTPDGRALLTIDEGGRLALWDARKGKKIRDFEGIVADKLFVISGFSKDGRTVAVLDGGGESEARVIAWNAA